MGRTATSEEIAGCNIDIRPDGEGLPAVNGSVKDGEALFTQRCAGCNGEFGEGVGRWPVLAGRAGTLNVDRPTKTIGLTLRQSSTMTGAPNPSAMLNRSELTSSTPSPAIVCYLMTSSIRISY